MRQIETFVLIIILSILIEQITLTSNIVLGQTGYSKSTYVNENLGLQFQYPSPWGEAIDSDSSGCNKLTCYISFVIRDPFSKSIDLFIITIDSFNLKGGVQDSCNCKTLMDFVHWDYDRKFRTDNNLIIQNQTRVNSHHDAWQMQLSSMTQKEMTQKLVVWTIDGNTGYRIHYSAPAHRFTEDLVGFEDMLKSFTFAEHSEARTPTCLLFNLVCL
jgi:hypothetical protein